MNIPDITMAQIRGFVVQSVWRPIEPLFTLHNSFNYFTLLSALFFVFGALLYQNRLALLHPRRLRRALFPSGVFLHPSSLFDYRYYFLSRILIIAPILYVIAPTLTHLYESIQSILHTLFGAPPVTTGFFTTLPGRAITTLLLVVVFDFGYWLHHWLMHRFEWLWYFHKPHHSAQRLNVFTSVRAHPLEEIFAGILIALATALLTGVLNYFSTAPIKPFEIAAQNAILLVFYMTFYHLRHTQVWLPITGAWGHILQSPAHHQIHHSTDPRHHDKNFGFCLSIWDWLFGTLYVPERKERIIYGIGAESEVYNNLYGFLFRPFGELWRKIITRRAAGQLASADSTQEIRESLK